MDKITVYHLLHGRSFGKVIGIKSKGEDFFSFNLPGESRTYRIKAEKGDDLFPLVIDGDLIFDAFHHSPEPARIKKRRIGSWDDSMRKINLTFPFMAMPDYVKKGDKTEVSVSRHFMLLPTNRRLFIRRFDKRFNTDCGAVVFWTGRENETVAEWMPIHI